MQVYFANIQNYRRYIVAPSATIFLSISLLFIGTLVYVDSNIDNFQHLVYAAPVHLFTLHFTAKVDVVSPSASTYFNNSIKSGDIITGTITYDLATPDKTPLDLRNIRYEYLTLPTPFDITMKVNNIAFGTNPDNIHSTINVINGDPVLNNILRVLLIRIKSDLLVLQLVFLALITI